MILDLDGFKEVNDSLGHSAGDALLKEVAARLHATCKDAITVARLGGDEFVALLKGDRVQAAGASAQRLVDAVSQPIVFAGQTIQIGASVGVALSPAHGSAPEDLLSAADLALYKAKGAGKGRSEVFVPALRDVAVARRALRSELFQAFQKGEFELYYQPQVLIRTRDLIGAEALMRWNHPQRGLLAPDAFMDVLAEKPIAAEVGEWTIRTACRQAAEWRHRSPNFRISVNLFESQLRSMRLLTAVQGILEETRLPPAALNLEIVENILLQNDPNTLALLHDLRIAGVGLAFDDYGTGFASLSLLKRYPVSCLKIDRSFIRDVNVDPEDAAVVNAVVYLGKSFGLDVVAEGVETEAQLSFLRRSGCVEAQGYLFGRPMPAKDFQKAFLSRAA